ncbi:bifunctional (p)ppGpp synthetase/guanosine-3',5'-bis(diphosphate) 3'-pyrophosphohydrolase [Hyphomicrobium methylovorum]|uniref:RelA/SpoT family protein n=1 Tax=Hyphomicrobium methylovorum TaxID=84 RepID=UPI0015E79545|nr:bifunctional (p)ppGpp synthetase/guanosine-3',5'-bis(diphosphate) 3'-pyrophosphohydrolase [Hyphomicrobium methylovorum]MBA2125266.1 bifunctional (p)ppGpp synthetase/guanosine-3',5'-bis(diphosphate) 3'-pyrophosphohydrolase [Hyphomicrobium methylovorum]
MMRQYELVERVLKYDPKADEALLNRAYVYAMKAHGNQRRASGAPYFSHPLEVAAILTDLKLDDATIATALLHDVIEDTDATRTEIDQMFGPEIGSLVDGLTKIKRLDLVSKKAEQAENFRKLLIAISTDIRVLLVKLADRLHNMRTLEHMKPESRRRNSEETLDIYAPLAGMMGMQALREELEDHAFRWLHPDAYQAVTERLSDMRNRNRGLVEEIRQAIARKCADAGIKADTMGREKKPYAIWSKMEHKQISLEQLSDIYGFRVLVDSIEDCYRVLGIVHTTWSTVPGRFKDYVSAPKRNNYQSIHTTVYGPRHQRVELQIRTHEMHHTAEYGIAAHAIYKNEQAHARNGHDAESGDDSPYGRLRAMISTLLEAANPEEFLEHTKLELFHDQVFCFTPKGRLIALPRGATPLDFAYAVHTDIGNEAIAAYINGRHMPIDTHLRNGDEVVIETSKNHVRPAAWEAFAVTGRARAAIRRAAREAERRRFIALGRQLLGSSLAGAEVDYSEEKIKAAALKSGFKSADEMFAAIGRDEIALSDLLGVVIPNAPAEQNEPSYKPARKFGRAQAQDGWVNIDKVTSLKFRSSEIDGATAVSISGPSQDLPIRFEPGGAVPGDRIVGVMAMGEGIRVFQIHSPRLKEYEQEHWIDVTWDIDPEHPQRFPARISVTALNAPGSLADIARVIGETGGNIDNIKMAKRAADFTVMHIDLEVFDLVHLNHIVAGLRAKPAVAKVERLFE